MKPKPTGGKPPPMKPKPTGGKPPSVVLPKGEVAEALRAIFHKSTSALYGDPKTGKSTLTLALDAVVIALDPMGYRYLPRKPDYEFYDPEGDIDEVEESIKEANPKKLLVIDSITALGWRQERKTANEYGVKACSEVDYGKATKARNNAFIRLLLLACSHPAGCLFIAHTETTEFKKKSIKRPMWIDASMSKTIEATVASIVYLDENHVLHTKDMELKNALCGSNNPAVEDYDKLKITKADLGI